MSATPSVALPLAPGSLTKTNGNTQGTLMWDAVDDAIGYKVFRRTKTGAWPSTPVGMTTGTIFNDTGIANGLTYCYSIAAVNENGFGAWSSSDAEITPTVSYAFAPESLAIFPGNTQATITWNPVVGATKYHVEVAESAGGDFVKYGSSFNGKPSFTFTELTNDKTYYFRVRADYPRSSAYSDEISTVTSATLPYAPASITKINGNTQGTLMWNAVEGSRRLQCLQENRNKRLVIHSCWNNHWNFIQRYRTHKRNNILLFSSCRKWYRFRCMGNLRKLIYHLLKVYR